jgi:hypothetical protein
VTAGVRDPNTGGMPNSNQYVVSVPFAGEGPAVSLADPSASEFPARKLTDVGGQFPAWSADGRRVHWSIGSSHFVYDLERARQVTDSIEQARRAAGDTTGAAGGIGAGQRGDTTRAGTPPPTTPGPAANPRGYQPAETRITLRARRDIPEGSAVLRGARVITMRGNEVIENADIVIRNNRIVGVGARGSVQVPPGARVVDLAGKTIVPGFVDTHAHLRLNQNIHQQPWSYLANLAYGVTTTRDPQTGSTDVLTPSPPRAGPRSPAPPAPARAPCRRSARCARRRARARGRG